MRVGVDRTNYKIKMPLPPKIDPSVTMMQVEEKPDVTYDDIGGCKEQIDKLREVVEMPLLNVSLAPTVRERVLISLSRNVSSSLVSILQRVSCYTVRASSWLAFLAHRLSVVRPARNRKDPLCTSSRQQNRSDVYPSHRVRVGAKVCRRRCTDGEVSVCEFPQNIP